MRKGIILIFTQYEADICFDYLIHTLSNIHKFIQYPRSFKVNGYTIKIFRRMDSLHLRGCRPEIAYYFNDAYGKDFDYNEKRYINNISLYKSQRKQPIRHINNITEIDLKELINDDYSLLKCNFKKINWKDKFKYIWLKIRNKFRRNI